MNILLAGENGRIDHLLPILVDHLNFLIINKVRWSWFSGRLQSN